MKSAWLRSPTLPTERVGGVSVLERQLFLLSRAGFERAGVEAPRPDGRLRLPEGLDVTWGAAPVALPHLEVSGRHLVRLAALKEAVSGAPARWRDERGDTVLAVVGEGAAAERPLTPGSSVRLESPLRGGPVDAWLMREAVKGTDGFMAKHFDRHISLAVTRLLLDTSVTPNVMTLASTAVGLCGAGLLAAGTYRLGLAGALLIWLHSTLDGCDGELARLRFQESALGGVLDFWGDNLVHAALFLCLGAGVARAEGTLRPAALGIVAAASASVSATLAYLHSKRKAAARKTAGPFFSGLTDVAADADAAEKRLAAVEDALAQRDFVYLLVALAAAGRLGWFLWASAVGSPLFLAVLLWLRRPRLSRTSEFV